jgi:hypothetical protein
MENKIINLTGCDFEILKPYKGKKVKIITHSGVYQNYNDYNKNPLFETITILFNEDDGGLVYFIDKDNNKFQLNYPYTIEIINELTPGDYIYVSDSYEDCHDKIKQMFVSMNPFGIGVNCVANDNVGEAINNNAYNTFLWKYYKPIQKPVWENIVHGYLNHKYVIYQDHICIDGAYLDFDFIHTLEKDCLIAEKFNADNKD